MTAGVRAARDPVRAHREQAGGSMIAVARPARARVGAQRRRAIDPVNTVVPMARAREAVPREPVNALVTGVVRAASGA
ncbi:hypothetical protein IU510_01985 [Nocardia cyriacigeorgica]|uniref:hypothetical protein n=1 Tax=Nocardia cyriacigeorgica TaxID=135487 RepID=UPI001895B41B|nr:hypothetical protein [Nocardia cyriacigeorgica]MBF6096848.1 hypothetical protein [Nocardia cyriacigeorgica]MBF6197987.1 hypothetical protein [Nocardia cyriacigeorgica]MBF6316848.1 hypothetical protein [Nocardia cyriacigeorgica]MBF6513827.1 hypothetical protein [Nocardia cyriacigeorgica]MBF6535511.1 hypothetical protein [Nocardia cyriacigeorgica]